MEEDENSQIQLQEKDENMEISELYLEDEDPLQDKGQVDRDMSTCFGFVVSSFLMHSFQYHSNFSPKKKNYNLILCSQQEEDGVEDEEEVDKSSIQLLDYVE